jgi:hypothetical protein
LFHIASTPVGKLANLEEAIPGALGCGFSKYCQKSQTRHGLIVFGLMDGALVDLVFVFCPLFVFMRVLPGAESGLDPVN